MMKLTLLDLLTYSFLFGSPLSSAGESPWTAYSGCYTTLEWNGNPVPPDDQRVYPFDWYEGSSRFFTNPTDESAIPAFNIWLFQKFDSSQKAAYHEYMPIFLDRGETTQSPDLLHYQFNGALFFHHEEIIQAFLEVSIRPLANPDEFQVFTHTYIKDHDDLNGMQDFVVKRCKN